MVRILVFFSLVLLVTCVDICRAESEGADYRYHRPMLHEVTNPNPFPLAGRNIPGVTGTDIGPMYIVYKELVASRVLDIDKLKIQWVKHDPRPKLHPASEEGVLDRLPKTRGRDYSVRLIYQFGADTSLPESSLCANKGYVVVDVVPGKWREELYCLHESRMVWHQVTFVVGEYEANTYLFDKGGENPHWQSTMESYYINAGKSQPPSLLSWGYLAHPSDYSPLGDPTEFERGFKNVNVHLVPCDNLLFPDYSRLDPNVKKVTTCIGVYDGLYVRAFSYMPSVGNALSHFYRLLRIEKNKKFPKGHFDAYLTLESAPQPILPCPVLCDADGNPDWEMYKDKDIYTDQFNKSRAK